MKKVTSVTLVIFMFFKVAFSSSVRIGMSSATNLLSGAIVFVSFCLRISITLWYFNDTNKQVCVDMGFSHAKVIHPNCSSDHSCAPSVFTIMDFLESTFNRKYQSSGISLGKGRKVSVYCILRIVLNTV